MKSVTVSNVRQLRRAFLDPKVDRVVLNPGTYRIRKPLIRSAAAKGTFTIDGQGSTVIRPAESPGVWHSLPQPSTREETP